MEQNKFEGWTIVGWSSTIPNVTEKEFFDYIHALEPVCSAISWSEWKNPKQLPNLKSYKIQVKEKILNSAPAKPPVSDGRTSENRSDSNEKRTAQDRGAIQETGGRLSSKKNKKEQKNL